MYGSISDPGIGFYLPLAGDAGSTNPSQSAINQWGWGFHTVRGGNDQGNHRFHPRCVGVLDMQPYILPEWSRLYEPQPVSNQPVGLGFPHRAGRIDPGNHRVRPRCVGVLDVWKDF